MRVLQEFREVLWEQDGHGGESWDYVGNFDKEFKLVIPVRLGLCGTTTFKSYRTWWQVEAGKFIIFSPFVFTLLTRR